MSRVHFVVAEPPLRTTEKSPCWAVVPCFVGVNRRKALVKSGQWPVEAAALIVGSAFSARALESSAFQGQTQLEAKEVRAENNDRMVLLQSLIRENPRLRPQSCCERDHSAASAEGRAH